MDLGYQPTARFFVGSTTPNEAPLYVVTQNPMISLAAGLSSPALEGAGECETNNRLAFREALRSSTLVAVKQWYGRSGIPESLLLIVPKPVTRAGGREVSLFIRTPTLP